MSYYTGFWAFYYTRYFMATPDLITLGFILPRLPAVPDQSVAGDWITFRRAILPRSINRARQLRVTQGLLSQRSGLSRQLLAGCHGM